MSKVSSFDPAKLLELHFRIARAGSKTFTFKDSNGDPFDISTIEFMLSVRKWNDVANAFELTEGSGLTTGGAGSNELTAVVDEINTDLTPGKYFWELYNITSKKTWLNGPAHFHNGEFDAPPNSPELVITTEGNTVTVTLADTITEIDGGTP